MHLNVRSILAAAKKSERRIERPWEERKIRLRSIQISAMSIAAHVASTASAQVAVPASPKGAAPARSQVETSIAEIIVTANKRSETIDPVPLALAAVTGAADGGSVFH